MIVLRLGKNIVKIGDRLEVREALETIEEISGVEWVIKGFDLKNECMIVDHIVLKPLKVTKDFSVPIAVLQDDAEFIDIEAGDLKDNPNLAFKLREVKKDET